MLERLPERSIITFDVPDGVNLRYDNPNMSVEWEWALRSIKAEIQRRGYPAEIFRHVSTAVAQEDVQCGVPQCSYVYASERRTSSVFPLSQIVPTGLPGLPRRRL